MDDFEKRLEEDMKKISDKLDEYELSEEFKERLAKRMDYEYNKPIDKGIKNKSIFVKKLVASFACCFVILSTCVAFGDEFESLIAKVFSNTDKEIEQAIENGNYKEINMDYVEDNGVSVKVDYIVKTENSIYFAFNVLVDEEYDDLYFNDIEIKNENDEDIFKFHKTNQKSDFILINKDITNNNSFMLYNLKLNDYEKNSENKIKFYFHNMITILNNEMSNKECNLNFMVDVK